MDKVQEILTSAKEAFLNFWDTIVSLSTSPDGLGLAYTAVARWIFIALALFIVVKSIASLLKSKNPSEVWAYFNIDDEKSYPITHWENAIGRAKNCDLIVDDPMASRNQGTLTRGDDGVWKFKDLGSKNGTYINGKKVEENGTVVVEPGDEIIIGSSKCTLFPISLEEQRNNMEMRLSDTILLSPWPSLIAITVFQLMTIVQLKISLAEEYSSSIAVSFFGLMIVMWAYVIFTRGLKGKGYEMETIAFFLCTLSLSVTASKYPTGTFKQFIAIAMGVALFVCMCTYLRNLERAKAIRMYMYGAAALLLVFNLIFGQTLFGASNWVKIGGISFQPSELVKLAFIWAGAASLDELLERRNSIIFMLFSGFCFCCLALMGDFGTAIIFFVTFLIISFLRSGDVTKLVLIVGVAFVGGLMVLKFKSYVANRFATWGHVWEMPDNGGFQQTRTMSAAASGGLVGVGAGRGWLKHIPASETDLVFGFLTEEWGLIIAVLAILSLITLSIFAVRSILAGRSTYYTIASCSAMSMFLFQTMLNVFGSVDIFPLTGVTLPFVSSGGTSMVSAWGLLAFLKAADTRANASFAVSQKDKAIPVKRKRRHAA